MYFNKTLIGEQSTDTFDGRTKSLDGNRYAQVFANKRYFSKLYPMDCKTKAREILKIFCKEFSIPEILTFDGSKKQCMRNIEFQNRSEKTTQIVISLSLTCMIKTMLKGLSVK